MRKYISIIFFITLTIILFKFLDIEAADRPLQYEPWLHNFTIDYSVDVDGSTTTALGFRLRPMGIEKDTSTGDLYIAFYSFFVKSGSDGIVRVLGDPFSDDYRMNGRKFMTLYNNKLYYVKEDNRLYYYDLTSNTIAVVIDNGSGCSEGDISTAKFTKAEDVEYGNGYLYIADSSCNRIFAFNLSANYVTIVAGAGSSTVNVTGTGLTTNVYFAGPSSLGIDSTGNTLYVQSSDQIIGVYLPYDRADLVFSSPTMDSDVECGNTSYVFTISGGVFQNLWKIDISTGNGVNLVSSKGDNFYSDVVNTSNVRARIDANPLAGGLCYDNETLYFSDFTNMKVRAINLTTTAVTNIFGTGWYDPTNLKFYNISPKSPSGIYVDSTYVYYIDRDLGAILRTNRTTNDVELLAGWPEENGALPYVNGVSTTARLGINIEILTKLGDYLYYSGYGTIQRLNLNTLEIENVAGAYSSTGAVDGNSPNARLSSSQYGMVGYGDYIYFTDWSNHAIRALNVSNGLFSVTTVAGVLQQSGDATGTTYEARFYFPTGIAIDSLGNTLFVVDYGNNKVKAVDLVNNIVYVLANLDPAHPYQSGIAYNPNDPSLYVYQANGTSNAQIIKISLNSSDYLSVYIIIDSSSSNKLGNIPGALSDPSITLSGSGPGGFGNKQLVYETTKDYLWFDQIAGGDIRYISFATPSPTVTPTLTATPTLTTTPTLTITRTITPTSTPTLTATKTITLTNTATTTPTLTITKTVTSTATPTLTITTTNTTTNTPTGTQTFTVSPTLTVTNTITRTSTLTITSTATLTFTYSSTPTITHTNTVTFTPTITSTFTITPTITNTGTWTLTATRTITPTVTITKTFTISPTFSNTSTITPTLTITPTFTITPTYNPTPHYYYSTLDSLQPAQHTSVTTTTGITFVKFTASGPFIPIAYLRAGPSSASEVLVDTLPNYIKFTIVDVQGNTIDCSDRWGIVDWVILRERSWFPWW